MTPAVIWHDVECGSYTADLPLWRELAASAGSGVLDIGAGTGRVALDLGRRGHEVLAIDTDSELVAALTERAAGLGVRAVQADARSFDLGQRLPDAPGWGLCIVPMQTIQLLGERGRTQFLGRAHSHLRAGGLLAATLADVTDVTSDPERTEPPLPDMREVDGTVYTSQPVAVHVEPDAVAIERIRQTADPRGHLTTEGNVTRMDRVEPATLVAEAGALGFEHRETRTIDATDDHLGSQVVVLCRP
jgi:SAM-dependent methyltransferase